MNDAGATDILVVNLADVGLLPVAGSSAAFDSFASVGANAALNELIAPDQDNDELPPWGSPGEARDFSFLV